MTDRRPIQSHRVTVGIPGGYLPTINDVVYYAALDHSLRLNTLPHAQDPLSNSSCDYIIPVANFFTRYVGTIKDLHAVRLRTAPVEKEQ